MQTPFPDKKYQMILADPPWTYRDKAHAGQRGAGFKYHLMTIEDLIQLPINTITDEHCLLAMWHVPVMPEEALMLVKSWGFQLKTMKGFTWHKTTKNHKDFFGMGNWTRANTEDCLFATKGKPQRVHKGIRQLIHAQIREHSRKPDEVKTDLVRLMGDIPRIELFSRDSTPGWDHWGDQLDNFL